jgi:hypothetical protein
MQALQRPYQMEWAQKQKKLEKTETDACFLSFVLCKSFCIDLRMVDTF